MKKDKIYELKIEEDDLISGIDSISLVSEPAIEISWVAFNKEKPQHFHIPDGEDEKYLMKLTQYGQSEDELLQGGYQVHSVGNFNVQRFFDTFPNAQSEWNTDDFLVRYKYTLNPEAGGQRPIEATTRDFCRSLINRNMVFRIEDMDRLTNDEGDSALVWRGGYNCRHSWSKILYKKDTSIVNKASVNKGKVLDEGGVFPTDMTPDLGVLGYGQPDTRTSNPSFSKESFRPNVPHYTEDGELYEGPTHEDADGRLMTGAVHTEDSEYLYHEDELEYDVSSITGYVDQGVRRKKKKKDDYAEVGPRGGIRASPKAPKSDTPNPNPKGEGTSKGDASGKRGAKVTAEQEKTLQKKVDDFNEKESNTKNGRAALGALKSVFQRGLGAFNTSHSPNVSSSEQWAYARVNAFLYLIKNGRPENPKYTTDNDLLPKGHPKEKMSSQKFIKCKECGHSWDMEDGGIDIYICHKCGNDTKEDFKSYTDYPDSVKNNAKAVLKYVEENGWGSCGTNIGRGRATDLANGSPISEDTIKRMYSYLSRHEVDLESSKSYDDGCGKLMFDAWGGKSGLSWSEGKLKSIEREKMSKQNFQVDTEKRIVVGAAMVPNLKIFRKDKEGNPYYVFFTSDTIKIIADKYMRNKYTDNNDTEHNGEAAEDVYVIESWIKEDKEDKSNKYGFQDLPIGTWFVSMKVRNDEVWKMIKDKKLNGYSVSGFFEEIEQFNKEQEFLKQLAEILKKV